MQPHAPIGTQINRRTFLGLVGSGLAYGVLPAREQLVTEREEFFRQGIIPRFEIELTPKDLQSLRQEPRKYVPATLKVGKETVFKVGVHLKGAAGSFRGVDDKPALTVNLDKYVAGQHYHGLDKFHLNNSVQDGTYLMELLCAELFHAAGVPVSFCSHALVTLQGRKRGFFVLKEGYDKGFLQRTFRNTKGNLYDGGFLQDLDAPLQQLAGTEGPKDRADLKAVVQACALRNHAERLDRLEQLIDLEKFLTLAALEVITWHWDGYAMKRNNYRIYHEPTRGKLYFIAHGMDQMFGDPNGPIQPGFEGMVARAVVQTGVGKQRYRECFAQLMRTHFKPDRFAERIDDLENRVRPVLTEVDANAGKEYPQHLKNLRHLIRVRAEEISKQMKRDWQKTL